MSDEYAKASDVKALEKRVDKLEDVLEDNEKLLQGIDKKVDVIFEKLISVDKAEDLKLKPVEDRVTKLEKHQTWLWEVVGGAIILAVLKLVIGG